MAVAPPRKTTRWNCDELDLIQTSSFENRCVFVSVRINGQLVALKMIRMKTEEGIPFTAIREGEEAAWVAQTLQHL